jgi:hypothetical protein
MRITKAVTVPLEGKYRESRVGSGLAGCISNRLGDSQCGVGIIENDDRRGERREEFFS